ncbi:MAG: hypothetical protein MK538_14085 [Planctomycetes bacterium]|nr:hypothetical protein [Planctomycetota bacterium]
MAHNSLKAHVFFHRLVHDRALGVYDKERFMAYIQLPRSCAYVNLRYLKPRIRGCAIDLNADYRQFTLLPAVSDDEPLVCSCLEHFFLTKAIYTPDTEYIRDTYLDGGGVGCVIG